MASASDDFNRADGDLGSNWTEQSSVCKVDTNKARSNGGQYQTSFWNAVAFANDHNAQAVFSLSVNYAGVGARMSGVLAAKNWYAVWGHGLVEKAVAGSITTLASPSAATLGDTLKIEVIGTAIHGYYNGVEITGSPWTDSSLASGAPGITFYDLASRLDDWAAADVGAPGKRFMLVP